MQQKLITFAVPCYNSAAYMRHCIETLLSAGEQAEIILVDDGSTKDDTPAICDEYAAKGQVKKMWLGGIGIPLGGFNVIRAIPTFLIVYYGSQYSSVVEGLMPDWLNNAMGVVGGMLPAVGMALLLKVMLKKKSHWCFFLIGFLAYSVFGISAVTLTILAICLAVIIDQTKAHNGPSAGTDDLAPLE